MDRYTCIFGQECCIVIACMFTSALVYDWMYIGALVWFKTYVHNNNNYYAKYPYSSSNSLVIQPALAWSAYERKLVGRKKVATTHSTVKSDSVPPHTFYHKTCMSSNNNYNYYYNY